jgi:HD-like signal output (HDOD) protein
MPKHREHILNTLENIENLPSLPDVVLELSQLVKNDNSDAGDLVRVIEKDPAIVTRVLKMANSSTYRRSDTEITNIQNAVVRLGYKTICHIATTTGVFSVFPVGKEQKSLDRDAFWEHCSYVGDIAQRMMDMSVKETFSFDKSRVALAGLIHDIGIIVMEQYFNDLFVQILTFAQQKRVSLQKVEKAALGITHLEIGHWIGKKWGLDQDLLDCLLYYDEPHAANKEHQLLVEWISVAKKIGMDHHFGDSGHHVSHELSEEVWDRLELNSDLIPVLVDQVREQAQATHKGS